MKSLLLIAVAASSLMAGQAHAQSTGSYYARERITGLTPIVTPSPTPTPTPTPTPVATPAAWSAGAWSAYSSTCSPSATKVRTVQCKRGADTVLDTLCTDPKPPSSQTDDVDTSCTYTAQYGPYDTCSAEGQQYASYTGCLRSDGKSVDRMGDCGMASNVISRSCTPPVVVNCTDPVFGYASSGPSFAQLGPAVDESGAGNLCRAYANSHPGMVGVCIFDRSSKNVSMNGAPRINYGGNYSGSSCSSQ